MIKEGYFATKAPSHECMRALLTWLAIFFVSSCLGGRLRMAFTTRFDHMLVMATPHL
jgi:hypothetical protein